jgi:superfamily II DNA or RNA helicase
LKLLAPPPALPYVVAHIANATGLFYTQQERVKKLAAKGELDVVIHVGQLGEGFDAPTLSVVAVFKVFRSMAPFMQLLGRAARRILVRKAY